MLCDVYRNLHKGCMSIKSREKEHYGRVIAHSNLMYLVDCNFIVRKKGHQKVLATKRKNVHAFVRGKLISGHGVMRPGYNCQLTTGNSLTTLTLDDWVEVTYNPYQNDAFIVRKTGKVICRADRVFIKDRKVYVHRKSCGV